MFISNLPSRFRTLLANARQSSKIQLISILGLELVALSTLWFVYGHWQRHLLLAPGAPGSDHPFFILLLVVSAVLVVLPALTVGWVHLRLYRQEEEQELARDRAARLCQLASKMHFSHSERILEALANQVKAVEELQATAPALLESHVSALNAVRVARDDISSLQNLHGNLAEGVAAIRGMLQNLFAKTNVDSSPVESIDMAMLQSLPSEVQAVAIQLFNHRSPRPCFSRRLQEDCLDNLQLVERGLRQQSDETIAAAYHSLTKVNKLLQDAQREGQNKLSHHQVLTAKIKSNCKNAATNLALLCRTGLEVEKGLGSLIVCSTKK